MSFNDKHINLINTSNYEEYFILYIDNELNQLQRIKVEEFIANNPEYKTEFELLSATKLTLQSISNINKDELMSDSMKKNLNMEDLLLYLDNELPAEKTKILDEQLTNDDYLKKEYSVLLKTRLDAIDKIHYPDKNELYKRSKRPVISFVQMLAAASVILLFTSGIVYFLYHKQNEGSLGVAVKKFTPSSIHKDIGKKIPLLKNEPESKSIEVTVYNQNKKRRQSKVSNKQLNNIIKHNTLSYNSENKNLTNNGSLNLSDHEVQRPLIQKIDLPLNTNLQSIVTYVPPKRITSEIAIANHSDAAKNSIAKNARKGSLKSFFRKAARVIEKKTGIDPANNDEELLIGVVAVKLK